MISEELNKPVTTAYGGRERWSSSAANLFVVSGPLAFILLCLGKEKDLPIEQKRMPWSWGNEFLGLPMDRA